MLKSSDLSCGEIGRQSYSFFQVLTFVKRVSFDFTFAKTILYKSERTDFKG